VIERLQIADRSILVTSRYDDAIVLARLVRLKIRLIPKSLAPFVPIAMMDAGQAPFDCVLIDDELVTHLTWKMAVKRSDKRLAYFYSVAEFLEQAAGFDKSVTVYIDSQLGKGVRAKRRPKKYSRAALKISA